jgi:hypothetical protein
LPEGFGRKSVVKIGNCVLRKCHPDAGNGWCWCVELIPHNCGVLLHLAVMFANCPSLLLPDEVR